MFVKIGVIIIAKKYYWLKLKEDFFRQKEIKKLRKIAGGDTYTIIYLKMMLLSLKDEGKLFFEGLEDSFIDEIALEIDEDLENVKVTIMFLIKCRLIEELTENEF
ncbi:phage replisome organizer N-terminal domain-containing protein [Clostridium botulinum]|nr:phage replisome organizer N-terminal domain-containing protein [Clostridium botulinum]